MYSRGVGGGGYEGMRVCFLEKRIANIGRLKKSKTRLRILNVLAFL